MNEPDNTPSAGLPSDRPNMADEQRLSIRLANAQLALTRARLGLDRSEWAPSSPAAREAETARLRPLVLDGAAAIGEFAARLPSAAMATPEQLARLAEAAVTLAEYSNRLHHLTKGTN